jgi:hypothetical protein
MPILELKANQSAIRRLLRAISDALFRHARIPADQPYCGLQRPGSPIATWTEPCPATDAAKQRLSEAVARLEHLDAERKRRADAAFGKATESRIVWSELIDLEMQELDQQVNRIRSLAGRTTQSDLLKGGVHERDDS